MRRNQVEIGKTVIVWKLVKPNGYREGPSWGIIKSFADFKSKGPCCQLQDSNGFCPIKYIDPINAGTLALAKSQGLKGIPKSKIEKILKRDRQMTIDDGI